MSDAREGYTRTGGAPGAAVVAGAAVTFGAEVFGCDEPPLRACLPRFDAPPEVLGAGVPAAGLGVGCAAAGWGVARRLPDAPPPPAGGSISVDPRTTCSPPPGPP